MSDTAVCLLERDGLLLCVWNRRYGGWTLPGGMVNPGERIEEAAARELSEETGLLAHQVSLIYFAPADASMVAPGRGTQVNVYAVKVHPQAGPREMEAGCPIAWLTRDEFLERVPFKKFYRTMFDVFEKADAAKAAAQGARSEPV